MIYRFKMYCEIHVRDDGLDFVSTGRGDQKNSRPRFEQEEA